MYCCVYTGVHKFWLNIYSPAGNVVLIRGRETYRKFDPPSSVNHDYRTIKLLLVTLGRDIAVGISQQLN